LHFGINRKRRSKKLARGGDSKRNQEKKGKRDFI
jgi:hypothetical protein